MGHVNIKVLARFFYSPTEHSLPLDKNGSRDDLGHIVGWRPASSPDAAVDFPPLGLRRSQTISNARPRFPPQSDVVTPAWTRQPVFAANTNNLSYPPRLMTEWTARGTDYIPQ